MEPKARPGRPLQPGAPDPITSHNHNLYMGVSANVYVYIYICICICIYIYMYMYMNMYIFVCIHVDIHIILQPNSLWWLCFVVEFHKLDPMRAWWGMDEAHPAEYGWAEGGGQRRCARCWGVGHGPDPDVVHLTGRAERWHMVCVKLWDPDQLLATLGLTCFFLILPILYITHTYRVLQKKNSYPIKFKTIHVMFPPSPNWMLYSEVCVWRPSKKKHFCS